MTDLIFDLIERITGHEPYLDVNEVENSLLIWVTVPQEAMPQLIGRQGLTLEALRRIARVVGSREGYTSVKLAVVEPTDSSRSGTQAPSRGEAS